VNIFERAAEELHFHHEEHPVTDPGTGVTLPAPPRQPSTIAQAIHSAVLHAGQAKTEIDDRLDSIGAALHHAIPLLERIVTDPALDGLMEAALRASDAAVAAEIIQAATDMLRTATAHKTGPQPVQPPPLAPEVAAHIAAAADPAVTGQQPAIPDAPADAPAAMADVPAPADPAGAQ
jgi:hypothetical protein